MYGNSFSHNEDIQIQFYDGTATSPFTLKLEGTNSGAELPTGLKGQVQRRIVHKGNAFHNYKKDLDEVPEEIMEFTATVFTEDFMGTGADARHVVEAWFKKEQMTGDTEPVYHVWDPSAETGIGAWVPTVSTNNATNQATILRSDEFTYGLKVLADATVEDAATGYDYPFVEVVDFRWLDNDDLEFRVQVRLLSTEEEVSVIQALS